MLKEKTLFLGHAIHIIVFHEYYKNTKISYLDGEITHKESKYYKFKRALNFSFICICMNSNNPMLFCLN